MHACMYMCTYIHMDWSLTLGNRSNSGPNARSTTNRIDDDTNATAFSKQNEK